MRPNIEKIRELANKATKGPWKVGREHGESGWSSRLPNGSDVIVSWGTQWALGLDVAAVPYKNTWDGQFIANARTDIPALIAYIDELENMPLVQTVVKLQEENERLKSIRGADKDHCHHRYLLTENCPYCETSRKMALRNERLQRENEKYREFAKWIVNTKDNDVLVSYVEDYANELLGGVTE